MNNIDLGIARNELARRLKTGRQNANFTQDDAAANLGIGRTTLVAIEKGERSVKTDEIRAFASLYSLPLNRLLQKDHIELDLVSKFRRQSSSEPGFSEAGKTLQLLSTFITTSVEIEKALGLEIPRAYPSEINTTIGRIFDLAEDAATTVRHQIGVGLAPIRDVASMLEVELGIRVFLHPLSSRISGAFAYDEKAGANIVLNSTHPLTRRNLTAAHELGHLVSSRGKIDLCDHLDVDDSREEKFANTFAAAFLMPAAWVRRHFNSVMERDGKFSARHLVLFSSASFTSLEASCRRLENLGLIKSGTWESLEKRGFSNKQAKNLGGATSSNDPTVPPRLAWLAASALSKGVLSEGQLVERLGIERTEIRSLVDLVSSDDGVSLDEL
jgi:Zn-dependent peptidase ImmA (M78 family)/DNA-binding XRE family transcriptional regulator